MPAPLNLAGVIDRIIQNGLAGLPIDAQLAEFSNFVYGAGFPMKRVALGMRTLHPRYGALTFVWRPDDGGVASSPRERSVQETLAYQESPIRFMIETGTEMHRQRLDSDHMPAYPVYQELRDEGMTDYAGRLVKYDPGSVGDTSQFGVFFSCATDEPDGFDAGQLQQVFDLLPMLAMAIKSRLTFDVARTVTETYLGQDAGRRVLTGEIERGSTQTMQAVIWFCDLRGFTELADTLARDDLIELLDDYLDEMARPVHDNQGQILKIIGDGFLATFDLTATTGEDVGRKALGAALELRTNFTTFNQTRQADGKPILEFGLALHVGDVFYGNIGANDRLDFTVVGPAVNEASRIQDLCRPLGCHVLMSRAFRDLVATPEQTLASVGTHRLRGVRSSQELFSLAA